MYPDKKHPSYGIFVKRFTDELDAIRIEYSLAVMHQSERKLEKIIGYLQFFCISFFKSIFSKCDLIYVHYTSHSSAGVLAAQKFCKRYIISNVHGSDVVPENAKQERMQKYTRSILAVSEKIVVPSEYFKDYVKEKYNLANTPFYVYPSGGIDSSLFYKQSIQKKKEFRASFGIEEGEIVFGFAGRLSSGKGWDTFVKAIAKSNIDAKFLLIGSGNEEKALEELIEELEVKDKLIRIGLLPQSKLSEFYNALDFLVFPTEREGESLGLVPIEAMACGTPVLSSNFAAPKHYILDGVNGFLFEKGNADALSGLYESCAGMKKDDYERLQRGAIATAEKYYAQNVREDLRRVFNE